MFKSLSKSTIIMFIFDLIILSSVSLYLALDSGFSSVAKISGVVIITLTGLFSLFLKGQYKIREFNITLWNAYRLLEGVIFAQIPALIVLAFMVDKLILLKYVGVNIIAIFVCLYVYRLGFHYYLFNLKKEKNILILGTNERAKVLAEEIKNKKALRMNVVGLVSDNDSLNTEILGSDYHIFSGEIGLKNIIKEQNVDIVVIAHPTEKILEIPSGVKLYKMPDFYELVTGKFYVDEATVTELYYQFVKKRSALYDISKRVYDIISATVILTVTLPITGFTALRIWLTDKGNPIYTQNRVGQAGRIFRCYKLRTMWSNNYHPKDLRNGGYAKNQEQDDRVIPWCKFVRKARFDEIPQMINILKGEMSIVGPRAEWDEVVKIYCEQIPYYDCRMWTKTGWTGWAQINQGHCINNDDIAEKLQYDLYYLKNRNVIWEICILVKAVFLALGGRHE